MSLKFRPSLLLQNNQGVAALLLASSFATIALTMMGMSILGWDSLYKTDYAAQTESEFVQFVKQIHLLLRSSESCARSLSGYINTNALGHDPLDRKFSVPIFPLLPTPRDMPTRSASLPQYKRLAPLSLMQNQEGLPIVLSTFVKREGDGLAINSEAFIDFADPRILVGENVTITPTMEIPPDKYHKFSSLRITRLSLIWRNNVQNLPAARNLFLNTSEDPADVALQQTQTRVQQQNFLLRKTAIYQQSMPTVDTRARRIEKAILEIRASTKRTIGESMMFNKIRSDYLARIEVSLLMNQERTEIYGCSALHTSQNLNKLSRHTDLISADISNRKKLGRILESETTGAVEPPPTTPRALEEKKITFFTQNMGYALTTKTPANLSDSLYKAASSAVCPNYMVLNNNLITQKIECQHAVELFHYPCSAAENQKKASFMPENLAEGTSQNAVAQMSFFMECREGSLQFYIKRIQPPSN